MDVKQIIKEYLIINKFDGLCNDDCGCSLDDLFPCGAIQEDCAPAYKCDCKNDCGEYLSCYTNKKINKCCKK